MHRALAARDDPPDKQPLREQPPSQGSLSFPLLWTCELPVLTRVSFGSRCVTAMLNSP